jgi:hypothetical protein
MRLTFLAFTSFVLGASAWSRHSEMPSENLDPVRKGRLYMPGQGTYDNEVHTGNSTFKQLIDHNNPALGTFDQFYFWSTEFWGGPGSPIVVFTPGEINASRYSVYLTTNRTTGVLAQELKAAGKAKTKVIRMMMLTHQ